MSRRKTFREFEAWLAKRQIVLTRPQEAMARLVLSNAGGYLLFSGRGSGKSFLFDALEEWAEE